MARKQRKIGKKPQNQFLCAMCKYINSGVLNGNVIKELSVIVRNEPEVDKQIQELNLQPKNASNASIVVVEIPKLPEGDSNGGTMEIVSISETVDGISSNAPMEIAQIPKLPDGDSNDGTMEVKVNI